jgi:hypothetical protein
MADFEWPLGRWGEKPGVSQLHEMQQRKFAKTQILRFSAKPTISMFTCTLTVRTCGHYNPFKYGNIPMRLTSPGFSPNELTQRYSNMYRLSWRCHGE